MFEHNHSLEHPEFQKHEKCEPGAEFHSLASDQFNNSRYFSLSFSCLSSLGLAHMPGLLVGHVTSISNHFVPLNILFVRVFFFFLEKEEQEEKLARRTGHILKW